MPIYNCVMCKFNSELKTNYTRHLKSKKHLNKLNNTTIIPLIYSNEHKMNTNEHNAISNEHKMNTNEHKMNTNEHKPNKMIKCTYCDKMFNTGPSKRRHEIKYCEIVNKEKEQIEELKAIIVDNKNNEDVLKAIILEKKKNEEKYKRDIEHLYKQIEILMEKKGNTTTIINIDKQINLNSYGKEDLSHITAGFKDNLLKIPFVSISKMIEEVHFSDKKPENKNIMLPNKKENYVKVYEDNKWVFKDKKSTITKLVDDNYNILDDHYEDTKDNEEKPIQPYAEKQYVNFRDLYNEGDKDLQNEIRVDCELVLLNNRK